METKNFKRTKLACYSAYFTMSSVFSLPPILFAIHQDMYNISYTLLGSLVLVNFITQLIIDLIFTAFPKYFNVKKIVRVMPLITSVGLFIFALVPTYFPQYAYSGLFAGTVLFSVSAGLSEVLLSPVIAAIPSDNPQKDMSLLHSLYAFGVFTVVVVSTLFLRFFGNENWMYLTYFWAVLPIISAVMFMMSPMPEMDMSVAPEGIKATKQRTLKLALCLGCIFFGSCAENTMSSWISSFMENSLGIDKTVGDILGMAMFAILLGMTRLTYAKYGKNVFRILFIGMVGATVCYVIVGLSLNTVFVFIACILVGIFSSMLWPGSLILMEEEVPGGVGVAAYALMAAGGDLGAGIAPQLLGAVVDKVSVSNFAIELSQNIGLSVEQIGLKAGMLITAIFPLIGTAILIFVFFQRRKA
ncbi:MAG: MFS transporter [Clostridia bacterium]|nr:MFS transporter [Clostridia bacterium]